MKTLQDLYFSVAVGVAALVSDEPASRVIEAVENPEWPAAGRVGEWRNYIPEKIRVIWPNLSLESRVIAFSVATNAANCEWF